MFTFHVDKSSLKIPKMVNLKKNCKPVAFGETELPNRLDKKLVKNVKIKQTILATILDKNDSDL